MRPIPDQLNDLIQKMTFVPPALRKLMAKINNEAETEAPLAETFRQRSSFLARLESQVKSELDQYFRDKTLQLELCSAADLLLIEQWIALVEERYIRLVDVNLVAEYRRSLALTMQWHLARLLYTSNPTLEFSTYPENHYWSRTNPAVQKPEWVRAENIRSANNHQELYSVQFARYIRKHGRDELPNITLTQDSNDQDCSKKYLIPSEKLTEWFVSQPNLRFDIAKDFAAMKLVLDVELRNLKLLHETIESGTCDPSMYINAKARVDNVIIGMHAYLDKVKKDLGLVIFPDAKKTEALIAEYKKVTTAAEADSELQYSMLNQFIQKLNVFDESLVIRDGKSLRMLSSTYYQFKDKCLAYATEADREAIQLIAHRIENKKPMRDLEKKSPEFSEWVQAKKSYWGFGSIKTVDDCFKEGAARQSPFYRLAKIREQALSVEQSSIPDSVSAAGDVAPQTIAQTRQQFFGVLDNKCVRLSEVAPTNNDYVLTLLSKHISGEQLSHHPIALLHFLIKDSNENKYFNTRKILIAINAALRMPNGDLKKYLENYLQVRDLLYALVPLHGINPPTELRSKGGLDLAMNDVHKGNRKILNQLMLDLTKQSLLDICRGVEEPSLDSPALFQRAIKIKHDHHGNFLGEAHHLQDFSREIIETVLGKAFKNGDKYLKKLPKIYEKLKLVFGEAFSELQTLSDSILSAYTDAAILTSSNNLRELYCLCASVRALETDTMFSRDVALASQRKILQAMRIGEDKIDFILQSNDPRKAIECVILDTKANKIYSNLCFNLTFTANLGLQKLKTLFENISANDSESIKIKKKYYGNIAKKLYDYVYHSCLATESIERNWTSIQSVLQDASAILQFCYEQGNLPRTLDRHYDQFCHTLNCHAFSDIDASQVCFLALTLPPEKKKKLILAIDMKFYRIKKLFQENVEPSDINYAIKQIEQISPVRPELKRKRKELDRMLMSLDFLKIDFRELNKGVDSFSLAQKTTICAEASEFFSQESFVKKLERAVFSNDSSSIDFLNRVILLHELLTKIGSKAGEIGFEAAGILKEKVNEVSPYIIGYLRHATNEQKKNINRHIIIPLLKIGDINFDEHRVALKNPCVESLPPTERNALNSNRFFQESAASTGTKKPQTAHAAGATFQLG